MWERRAPIAPHHVANLVEKGIDVIVQPSTRRGYTMDEYLNAGAIIQEDLSPASLILAVKQVPFFHHSRRFVPCVPYTGCQTGTLFSSFKRICPLRPLYLLLNRYPFFIIQEDLSPASLILAVKQVFFRDELQIGRTLVSILDILILTLF